MATTYLDGLEFTLQPNTGLGRRSVTVQVESNTPGLSPREANLKITQKGRPLTLEPTVAEHTGGGTIVKQSDPEGGNPGIYLLDHGYGAAGGSYTLDMTSNTNWYWYWNTDKGEDVHQANMDLVAQGWTATPADRVSTTDHPNDGHADHTWPGVASFTVPDFDRGGTAFDEAKKDQAQPDVPLGGERTVVRELRNVHPELTADDMEENARQLHIRRELPAHTHIIEWPWDDMTSLNWAMENNKYDDKMFRFGTNATGTLTLTTGFDLSEQSQLNREKQYTSAQGYKLFETTFSDLPRIALTPDSENDDPVFYKLRFTGRTANAEETANENVDEAPDLLHRNTDERAFTQYEDRAVLSEQRGAYAQARLLELLLQPCEGAREGRAGEHRCDTGRRGRLFGGAEQSRPGPCQGEAALPDLELGQGRGIPLRRIVENNRGATRGEQPQEHDV